MSNDECTIERIGNILADENARQILIHTSQEPMSADSLSTAVGASTPTIYRRLEEMRECELLVEGTQLDTEAGHHRTVYGTNLQRIIVELAESEFEFECAFREPMADRFTRLIEEM